MRVICSPCPTVATQCQAAEGLPQSDIARVRYRRGTSCGRRYYRTLRSPKSVRRLTDRTPTKQGPTIKKDIDDSRTPWPVSMPNAEYNVPVIAAIVIEWQRAFPNTMLVGCDTPGTRRNTAYRPDRVTRQDFALASSSLRVLWSSEYLPSALVSLHLSHLLFPFLYRC